MYVRVYVSNEYNRISHIFNVTYHPTFTAWPSVKPMITPLQLHYRAKGLHLQQDLSLSLSHMEILFYVASGLFGVPRPFPNLQPQAPYLAPMNRSNTFRLSQSIRIFHWAVIGGKELPTSPSPVILRHLQRHGCIPSKAFCFEGNLKEPQGVLIDSLIFLLLKVAMAQLSASALMFLTPWYSKNWWSKDNQNELCHVSWIKIRHIYTCIYIRCIYIIIYI